MPVAPLAQVDRASDYESEGQRFESSRAHHTYSAATTSCAKTFEDAGIKLASVASDVLGISGRAMLEALVQGTTDPAMVAELARGRLRGKLPALRQALAGRFRGHHAFLIGQLLAHLDYLDEAIGILSGQVETVIAPFADALTRLDSIPGINQRTAEVIIAEIGVDMSAFPSAGHLASWAALCPGNHESAGKHNPARRERATAGCARRSSKRPRGRVGPRTARYRHDSDGCSGIGVPRQPSWRSPMLSYARRTMSSRITRSIENWVPITTTGSTANASRVARSTSWSARAIA